MNNIIMQAITLGAMVAAFVCGKYVFPNMPKNVADKLNDLAAWAGKFVVWAREFMKASTGQEKMDAVVKELYKIAEEKGISVTENQLKAIAQAAYEAMKAGEKEAAPPDHPVRGSKRSGTGPCGERIHGKRPGRPQAGSGNGQRTGRCPGRQPGRDRQCIW